MTKERDNTNEDPEVIFLEPDCCADPYTGRSWSTQVKDWNECEEGFKPTSYTRTDIHTEVVSQRDALLAALKFVRDECGLNDECNQLTFDKATYLIDAAIKRAEGGV